MLTLCGYACVQIILNDTHTISKFGRLLKTLSVVSIPPILFHAVTLHVYV
jgi:hypothetical protein